jgi:hypothetical protein
VGDLVLAEELEERAFDVLDHLEQTLIAHGLASRLRAAAEPDFTTDERRPPPWAPGVGVSLLDDVEGFTEFAGLPAIGARRARVGCVRVGLGRGQPVSAPGEHWSACAG